MSYAMCDQIKPVKEWTQTIFFPYQVVPVVLLENGKLFLSWDENVSVQRERWWTRWLEARCWWHVSLKMMKTDGPLFSFVPTFVGCVGNQKCYKKTRQQRRPMTNESNKYNRIFFYFLPFNWFHDHNPVSGLFVAVAVVVTSWLMWCIRHHIIFI